MTLIRFCCVGIAVVLLGEAGLAVWRFSPLRPSTAPVFNYPDAAARFGQGPDMAAAIRIYMADRGAGLSLRLKEGPTMQVYYLEWDQHRVAPWMKIGTHNPEVCNVANGMKLEEIGRPRVFQRGSLPPIEFDYTRFTDHGGKPMYVFKTVWIQGMGTLATRDEGPVRLERIKNGATRLLGEARVLQGFVTEADSADEAWQAFERGVLERLDWSQSPP